MSGFAEWSLRSAFVDRTPQVALARGGTEIKGPGYQRFTPPQWDTTADQTECVARFGRFAVPMSFDEAWVMLGDQVIDRYALGESLFPVGSSFDCHYVLVFNEPD